MVRLPKRPPEGYTHEQDPWKWTNLVRNSCADVPYNVHDRFLHHKSGEPLTISYLGGLNFTGKTPGTWIGVEYDDASKGKHDGVFEGHSVFPVKQAGAGSFIKHTPELAFGKGRTFVEAFEERYGPIDGHATLMEEKAEETPGDTLTLGSSNGAILVEAPGMDRVKQNIGKLEKLREVGLEGEWVYTLGASDQQKAVMRERLKSVVSLNLSRNLLSSWAEVAAIVDCLPNLRTLVLKSIDYRTPVAAGFETITELHLGRSVILHFDLITIASHFPKLEKLYLNGNDTLTKMEDFDALPEYHNLDKPFHGLRLLDVSGCGISDWPSLCGVLAQFPALETLNISETPLKSIPSRCVDFPAPPRLRQLIWLDAQIQLLPDLDNLQTYIPHLQTLRFSPLASAFSPKNRTPTNAPACLQIVPPGANEEHEQTTIRSMIIAKFPSLTSLNSTPITPQERRDSELWYISHVRQLLSPQYPETTKDQWGQFGELCAKHEVVDDGGEAGPSVVKKPKTSALRSKMINLRVVHRVDGEELQSADFSILPSASAGLLSKKIEKTLGVSDIAVWTTKKVDGEMDKIAVIDSGKVGDWLQDGDEVWVEPP